MAPHRLRQGGAGDAGDRRLAGGVEGRHQHCVSPGQGGSKFLEKLGGAAVAVGLEYRQKALRRQRQGAAAALHHQPGCGQGGGHLAGVVGVVVDDHALLPDAAAVEAAAGGSQAGHRLLQGGEGHALQPARGDRGGGVAEVVAAWQRELQAAHQGALLVEVGPGAITPLLAGQGGEVDPLGRFGRPPAVGLKVLVQHGTVAVGQQPLAPCGEALQGVDQGLQVGVVVGVVELEVGEHAEPGDELHQGAVRLVGLRHQQPALALAAVAAEGGHHAADHRGGVVVGGGEQGGHQGAGGGFAVAAGHRDRGLAVDQRRQDVGAVQHGQAAVAGFRQLVVALGHGGADHHQRRGCVALAEGGDGGGLLAWEHAHTVLAQRFQHWRGARIGAAHPEPPGGQNPCKGRHADAADTDEVEGLLPVERQGQGHLRDQPKIGPSGSCFLYELRRNSGILRACRPCAAWVKPLSPGRPLRRFPGATRPLWRRFVVRPAGARRHEEARPARRFLYDRQPKSPLLAGFAA